MGALVAELNNGQLNRAVQESLQLLQRLGVAGTDAGQKIDKIGAGTGPRKASAVIADTQRRVTGLGSAAQRTVGTIRSGFAGLGGGVRSFTSSITGAATSLVNVRGAALGLVASLSFGSVISELRGFESTMAQVQGVTRTTGAEFEQLQDLARDLGRTTQFSAQEAADGILFLSRAGQDTATILKTLPPTLKFAQAGALGLGEAADFATNIMGAFNLGVDQTERTLNTLVVGANSANTDVRSMASAISFAGSAAELAGVSLETTAAAIGVLGDNGIPASRAGNALNKILNELASTDPPDRVVDTLAKLGLTIDDVNPAAVGLETAFQNLRNAGLDLTDATKLVGLEASGALSKLVQNADKVGEISEKARTTTDALDVLADTMSNTLDGALKRVSSAFSGLIQTIGANGGTSLLTRAFDGIAAAINFLTDNLDSLVGPIQAVSIALLGITAIRIVPFLLQAGLAVTRFVTPWGLVVTAVTAVVSVLLAMTGTTLPDVIRAIATFVDRVVGFFFGLVDAVVAVFRNFGTVLAEPFLKAFDVLGQVIEDFLNTLIRQFNKVGEIVGVSLDPVNIITPGIRKDYEGAATDISDSFVSGLDFSGASDTIEPVLTQLEDLGSTTEASTKQATTSITGTEEALKNLGETAETATLQTTANVQGTEQAFEDLGNAAQIATRDTVTGIEAADDRLKELNETAKDTGTSIEEAFDDGGQAADGFNDRVGTITGTFGQLFDELGTDIDQFSRNSETVANRLGGSLSGAFGGFTSGVASALGLAESQVGDFGGAVGVILDEVGFKGADIFNALGINADSKFGKVAGTAFRVFGRLADGQLTSLLAVGQNVFGGLGTVVTGIIPSITAFGGAAVSAFGSLAAAASTATVALGPIGLIFAAIAVAVLALILIFGDLNSVLSFLGDLFTKVGGDGSAAAIALQVAFAPVILPILAIIEAVQFLIDLFSGLGSTGSTVSTILTVVLAPIVVPIRLIIEAVQFLIGVFGNLGNAVQIFGNIARAIFDAITAVVRTFAGVFTTLINGAIGAATAAFRAFSAAVSGIFNAITAVVRTFAGAFTSLINAAIGAVTAFFRAFSAAVSGIFGGITAVVRTFAGAFRSVISGAVNVVTGVFRTFGKTVGGVFNAVSGAVKAFAKVLNSVLKVIKEIVSAAKKLANIKLPKLPGIGGIPGIPGLGGIGGKVIGGAKKVGKKVKKGLKKLNPFADGGLITGPVDLAAPGGLTQPRFRQGGLLDDLTFLSDAANVTPTRQLGVAGEAGEEFVVPAARTRDGQLGIKAIAPPQQQGQGGVMVVNEFNIDARGAGDEVIEQLRAMVRETQRSVPVISAQTTARMMRGVVRT